MGYDELPHFPTPSETFRPVYQGPPPGHQKQQMYTGYNNPRGSGDDLPHLPTPGEVFSSDPVPPPPQQHYGRPPPNRHPAPRKPSGGHQAPPPPPPNQGGYNNYNHSYNNSYNNPYSGQPGRANQSQPQLQPPPPMHRPGGPNSRQDHSPHRPPPLSNPRPSSGHSSNNGPQSPIPYTSMPEVNLKMLFNGVDKNNNGRLSEKELGNALVNGDFTKFNIETVRLMIKMFDRSGNGTIEFKEFCNLWRYLGDWRKLFDKFDLDKSGSISYDEYVRALEAFGYRLSNKFIQFMYSTYSSFNKSGERVIGFDLFVQSCISLKRMTDSFVQYDTDHTGYINLSFEQFLMEVMKLK